MPPMVEKTRTDFDKNHSSISGFEYLERVIEERERNYDAKFKAIEALVNERDRQYDARFRAAEIAVNAALVAQEKSVSTAFLASEKAVLKAEQAQKEYNERSNEFRGQLDDQAKTLMPRPETLNMFKALEEKVNGVQNVAESKFISASQNFRNEWTSLRESMDKSNALIDSQILALREARSEGSGKESARNESRDQGNWSTGIIVAIILSVVGTVVSIAIALTHAVARP
jgi:hypothetical protein